MDNEILSRLKSLGFKDYESRVFLVLLKSSAISASEIAKESGVIRNSIYDILKSFTEKGYCNEIETGSVLKYEMIDPEVIFDKLEREIKKRRSEEDDNIKETLKKLKPIYKSRNPIENNLKIELIQGYNQHRESKFLELVKSARKEILFMIKLEGLVSKEIDTYIKKFYSNGGIIKSVYESTTDFKIKKSKKWENSTNADFIDILTYYESFGEQIKISSQSIPNFTVFDGENVFMNIADKSIPKHHEADIIIRNRDFAQNLVYIFDTYWNNSQTISDFKKNNLV